MGKNRLLVIGIGNRLLLNIDSPLVVGVKEGKKEGELEDERAKKRVKKQEKERRSERERQK